jgi:hypothetical protein
MVRLFVRLVNFYFLDFFFLTTFFFLGFGISGIGGIPIGICGSGVALVLPISSIAESKSCFVIFTLPNLLEIRICQVAFRACELRRFYGLFRRLGWLALRVLRFFLVLGALGRLDLFDLSLRLLRRFLVLRLRLVRLVIGLRLFRMSRTRRTHLVLLRLSRIRRKRLLKGRLGLLF